MGEYMFGIARGKVTRREADRRDRICRREGGSGYHEFDQSHGTREGGDWIGWYTGPNRGAPFDNDLGTRVLAAVDRKRAT